MTDGVTPTKIPRALVRYRVMAIVTGSFLLLVTVGVILKYVVGVTDPTIVSISEWIAIVHGWIYVIYLLACVHLWVLMKWGLGRLVYLALGGIVPLLSFFAEAKIAREVAGTLDS